MHIMLICINIIYINKPFEEGMRFYGREMELEALREIRRQSEIESRFTVILGKRRVGKTSLMMESVRDCRFVYLFISRLHESRLCRNLEAAIAESGIDIPKGITSFGELIGTLMVHSRSEPLTVIIDEFQDLRFVDPSIFNDIQRVWDLYREGSHMNLLVSGSVHSMMVDIFENEKQPLFNRPTNKIGLLPFPQRVLKQILEDHNPDLCGRDLLTLYMLTGGVPHYVAALVDSGCIDSESMLRKVLSMDSVFLHDGRDILVSEFGRDYRTYLTIMQIIADGNERRKDIDDVLGTDSGPYLDRLYKVHGLVERVSPVFSKPDSRNSRWVIRDMYLRFYFRFIDTRIHYVESGRYDLLHRSVMAGLEEYEGRVLEDLFMARVREEWTYTDVGGYWNRDGSVKVDIVVIDDVEHRSQVIEVKRDPMMFDMNALVAKGSVMFSELRGYEVTYRGLSTDDVLNDPL